MIMIVKWFVGWSGKKFPGLSSHVALLTSPCDLPRAMPPLHYLQPGALAAPDQPPHPHPRPAPCNVGVTRPEVTWMSYLIEKSVKMVHVVIYCWMEDSIN